MNDLSRRRKHELYRIMCEKSVQIIALIIRFHFLNIILTAVFALYALYRYYYIYILYCNIVYCV